MLRSLVLFGPAAAWMLLAVTGMVTTAVADSVADPVDRHRSDVEGSQTCRSCHPGEYETWHGTFHRTMTQKAEGAAVLAPFTGETLDYLGYRATMTRNDDGRPHIHVAKLDDRGRSTETLLDVDVEIAVGSHRFQQYVARMDRGGGPDELWRLPVAWHVDEGRWVHMNAAFVEPDGTPGERDEYLRHLGRYNDNCLFCHNTEPSPGLQADGEFDSSIPELGIACEACHGPASQHIARQRNPVRRMLASLSIFPDDSSVADPGRMDPGRESAVCGRCHGNRIGHDIGRILREGDGFLPGTDLKDVSRPIYRDTTLAGSDERLFATRFWPDGTPRLSAYEYQGLLMSPCHEDGAEGGLGCNYCHDAHSDTPEALPRIGREGDAACTGCHAPAALGGADREGGHGGHGDRVRCVDCHMPRITYGLLEGLRTHRIANPDPGALVGSADQPDACTQCHVDRSRPWAATAMAELDLRGSPPGAARAEEAWAPRVALDLLGGDPLQRNLAAHAMASPEATGAPELRMAWLALALEDEYAAVRWAAWRGLRRLAQADGREDLPAHLRRYDYIGEARQRIAATDEIHARLPPAPIDDARRAWLVEHRATPELWIGE